MKALELVARSREYLDYVERHLNNVWKAFKEVEAKCADMRVIWDDFCHASLQAEVEAHDVSKFLAEEFTQYRRHFYPASFEQKGVIGPALAFEHHYACNDHHWQTWTSREYTHPYAQEVHCTHMVIDWLAMSYEFGDSPRAYYEKNKDKIKLPAWAIVHIYEMFGRLEK